MKKQVTEKAKKHITKKVKKSLKQKIRASQTNIAFNCPGSLKSENFPNPLKANDRAEYGTAVHLMASEYLSNGVDNDFETLKEYLEDSMQDEDESTKLEIILEITRKKDEVMFWIRQYASIVQYHLKTVSEHEIVVIDLKTGRTPVYAEDNTQLLSYLHLAVYGIMNDYMESTDTLNIELFNEIEFDKWYLPGTCDVLIVGSKVYETKRIDALTGVIYQPQLNYRGVSSYELDFNLLEKSYKDSKKLVTGPHCTWCEKRQYCPKLKKQMKAYLNPSFLDVGKKRPEELASVLGDADMIIKVLQEIKRDAQTLIKGGTPVPGYEIGSRPLKRVFGAGTDLAKIKKKSKLKMDEVAPRSLITPAALETIIGKKKFEDFAEDCFMMEAKSLRKASTLLEDRK